VISELVKPLPDVNVLNWLQNTPTERLFLSVVSIGEIRKVVAKLSDSHRKERLAAWLNTLIADYQDRIFSISLSVAENWGILQGNAEKTGRPMASLDGLIAATAYTHNLILVTRNESDFDTGVIPILNPWPAKSF
jgi:predicted nucleic acid-binding protein